MVFKDKSWCKRYTDAKSWDEATRILMLAGKALPVLPDALRNSRNSITGCESPVWIHCNTKEGRLYFQAFSSAKIVRGLVMLVIEPIQGIAIDEFKNVDFQQHLSDLALDRFLSPTRRGGVNGLVMYLAGLKSELDINEEL